MEVTYKINQKEDCFYIRKIVFMDEQGFENEYDEIDNNATFITIYDGDLCIGCARLFNGEENIKIFGRLAILKKYRGKKLGTKVLQYAEKIAKEQGAKEIHLHAQCQAIDFYIPFGYETYGEIELDESVEHQWMKKIIA